MTVRTLYRFPASDALVLVQLAHGAALLTHGARVAVAHPGLPHSILTHRPVLAGDSRVEQCPRSGDPGRALCSALLPVVVVDSDVRALVAEHEHLCSQPRRTPEAGPDRLRPRVPRRPHARADLAAPGLTTAGPLAYPSGARNGVAAIWTATIRPPGAFGHAHRSIRGRCRSGPLTSALLVHPVGGDAKPLTLGESTAQEGRLSRL